MAEGVDERPYRREERNCSFILSSLISVVLYVGNIAVTGIFLGFFIYVYITTDSENEDVGCFLFSDLNQSTALCDGSIAVICLLILLEVILLCLGAASLVSGKRGLCPKLPEAVMVFVCVLVCILLSSYLSSGMHTPDGNPCEDPDTACGKYEFQLLVTSWLMVILFGVVLIVQFADCIFHLPSQRNRRHRNEHWYDERVLLRSSEARRVYS